MKTNRSNESHSKEIHRYREWLGFHNKALLRRWKYLLVSDTEAAICEALTYQLLVDQGVTVQTNEDISFGGPDFLCLKNNKKFYVEVTCISKDAATRESGLSDMPSDKASGFSLLTKKIFGEVCNKTRQCSGVNEPCILIIGTLHDGAGCLCFNKHAAEDLLTGTPSITLPIDTRTDQAIRDPYETTKLQSAVFVRPIKDKPQSIEFARSPISAILLCPFAVRPIEIIGVLHPNPNRMFDRTLLQNITFGQLSEGFRDGQFKVNWI